MTAPTTIAQPCARATCSSAAAIARLAACAGASALALQGAVQAQSADSANPSTLIIAPLLEEMSSGPLPSMRLALGGPEDTHGEHGGASAIAQSGLSASASGIAPESFGAFHAPETVIARTNRGSQLSVSLFDSEEPDWVVSALSPTAIDMPAWRYSAGRARGRAVALRYEGRFDSPGGMDGLDVGLRPRAGLSVGDAGSATEFGASVRVGHFVSDDDSTGAGWWFFAGADRQALVYRPGDRRNIRETLTLQPYAMVGDQQAGIAMRVQGVDLSLAYVRRETSWSLPAQSWDTSEDFAAFSLTWRR
ncbi:lipid A-modifier LpxR family protein [Glycocaulis alkaliphilus]|uniref:lipid A-modifier LpxR family protein n=1 Tax=Glycocaulis alkaliphilus TaxID=1434191 RepID=UPI0014770CFA|nr:lipid A-modifier LpxR family protein [Glycocaulis alkaliphilus]